MGDPRGAGPGQPPPNPFAAAPAQGDGPDHYRPDSPDDFRVACRDVSMPLPEEPS